MSPFDLNNPPPWRACCAAPALALALLLLACSLLAGCNAHQLPAEWRPLERITEVPGLPRDQATTIGGTVFLTDYESWRARRPGERWNAFLLHEREHSRRQGRGGDRARWLSRYATEPKFAWREEQRGWFLELDHLRRHGFRIDPDAVASALHGYRTPLTRQRIVSRSDARAWVLAVLAGTWRPGP